MGLYGEKEGKLIYFVNVYASCDIDKRNSSWKKLVVFKNKSPVGSWCVGEILILLPTKRKE